MKHRAYFSSAQICMPVMSAWITVIVIILFLWRTLYYGHAGSCCIVHVGTAGR